MIRFMLDYRLLKHHVVRIGDLSVFNSPEPYSEGVEKVYNQSYQFLFHIISFIANCYVVMIIQNFIGMLHRNREKLQLHNLHGLSNIAYVT